MSELRLTKYPLPNEGTKVRWADTDWPGLATRFLTRSAIAIAAMVLFFLLAVGVTRGGAVFFLSVFL